RSWPAWASSTSRRSGWVCRKRIDVASGLILERANHAYVPRCLPRRVRGPEPSRDARHELERQSEVRQATRALGRLPWTQPRWIYDASSILSQIAPVLLILSSAPRTVAPIVRSLTEQFWLASSPPPLSSP